MKRSSRWSVPLVLVVGLALGVWLVIAGGSSQPPGTSRSTSGHRGGALDLSDTAQRAVAELGGFAFPRSTADFLTAKLNDSSQLDITFTIDPADEHAFVEGSSLPDPVSGDRVITHSSPLWKLNPDGTISGTRDPHGDVNRQVELVPEKGRLRVRAVLTPAT